ncbi:MAG: sugar kinase, partial [Clostridia bacterium]|nr:sugar kinase [Clostridia bacterium]
RGGDRLGIYYCEKGASMRPSKVVYDRANSAIATAKPGDFDWDAIFEGATWFHWTGITPALSDDTAAVTLEACKAAKAKGITISCDLNYRKNLWSREKAGKVMSELVPYVDVIIANEEDAADVFGIHAEATDINSGKLNVDGYKSVARQLVERFGAKKVAITLRESISANDNNWSGMLYDAQTGEIAVSKKYPIHIVDRVGGGDSFGAGLIYSQVNGMSLQDSVEFAVAASALKHTVEGDFSYISLDEVKTLMGGNASGRVVR